MPVDLIELLDRQYTYLQKLGGPQFLRQVPQFLRTLIADPRLRSHLADMRAEAGSLVAGFELHDSGLLPRLVALRDELARIAPTVDDSNLQPPPPRTVPRVYESSLAFFDFVAKGGSPRRGVPLYPTGKEDDSRARRLLDILHGKVQQIEATAGAVDDGSPGGPVNIACIQDLGRRLGNLSRAHEHEHHRFINEKEASPGFALLTLEHVVEQMNPKPDFIESEADFHRFLNETSLQVIEGLVPLLLKSLYGDANEQETAQLESLVDGLRPLVDRVHEDLRRRVGTIRSSRALLLRFKNRCEWHDRERLRGVAEGAKRPEEALVAELARWLFDQGLNPLTSPSTGGLKPDILDPANSPNVYVEAKQYRAATGTRYLIKKGMGQLHDTVMRLRGTPYEVHEAFYVVFRRGGPRCVLPETLQGEGWTTHLVLVDIADLSASGSRQRERMMAVSAEELIPLFK